MILTSLSLEQLRCIQSIDLTAPARFNLFVGQNGSGKTSILEAIHILGLGRSFRHSQLSSVIQHGKDFLRVTACLKDEESGIEHRLGLQKDQEGKLNIHIDHEVVHSAAKLASYLPLQLIHPDSDELITGGSTLRRQFIDWGVFHVEHSFYESWKTFHRLLKQRNAALKARAPRSEIEDWDALYVPAAYQVSKHREEYITRLRPYFHEILSTVARLPAIAIIFEKGWEGESLFEVLSSQYPRECHVGHTVSGSHRDELLVQVEGHDASSILSRGEQKLVMTSLKLAQAALLKAETQKSCVFLLDDFAAELDAQHRYEVIRNLEKLESQVFLTSIQLEEVRNAFEALSFDVFHVEHGEIKKVERLNLSKNREPEVRTALI